MIKALIKDIFLTLNPVGGNKLALHYQNSIAGAKKGNFDVTR